MKIVRAILIGLAVAIVLLGGFAWLNYDKIEKPLKTTYRRFVGSKAPLGSKPFTNEAEYKDARLDVLQQRTKAMLSHDESEEGGISRKTAYKWLKRDSTQEQSRRPHNSPKQTGSRVEQQVLAVRDEHPAWGGRKIARILQREHGIHIAPSTITSILHRNGRIIHENTHAAHNWQRFEHPYPNALWQMDFKGHFATDGGRCHPLTVIDDRSRYNIILRALANERREGVQAALTEAFRQYGLPDRINTDNGAP